MLRVGERIGVYTVRRPLGEGGQAEVYAVYDARLQREAALKLLRSEHARSAEMRERFLREARALARLRHPGIVAVHDWEESPAGPYFVMDLVRGESLADHLERRGPLPLAAVAAIVQQVAAVLDYLHGQRPPVVHRDIKPANVILAEDGHVTLLDFGIVRTTGAETRTGVIIGTLEYLAPEQVAGRPVSPAADIYALGAMTYELLSGRRPLPGGEPAAVLHRVLSETPPPLAQLVPALSPAAAQPVDQALAKDPAVRPPSAGALAASLARGASLSPGARQGERATVPTPRPPAARRDSVPFVSPPAWSGGAAAPRPTAGLSRTLPFLLAGGGALAVVALVLIVALASRGAGDGVSTTPLSAGVASGPDVAQTATVMAATTTPPPATVTPLPPPPPSPPPVRLQEIAAQADDPDCCRIWVRQAEGLSGGAVRLHLAFSMRKAGWESDNRPEHISAVSLWDERGRQYGLVEVSGAAGADIAGGTEIDGWYQFAPLATGTRWVWLQYFTDRDRKRALILGLDLGAAAPEGTPPIPQRTQPIGARGVNQDCCNVTVIQAEPDADGGVRLLLSFAMINDLGWEGDMRPEHRATIFLLDEQGRRSDLLEVTGPAAHDQPAALTLGGWYRFAPLAAGARQVRLRYGDAQIPLDLGAAAPAR